VITLLWDICDGLMWHRKWRKKKTTGFVDRASRVRAGGAKNGAPESISNQTRVIVTKHQHQPTSYDSPTQNW
jgi:hypothetical protein